VAGGDVDGHGPAVALHDEQLARRPLAPELAGEPPQIAIDDRLHVAVDRRGRAALVLAVFRQQLGAHRDIRVRPHGRCDLAGTLLVTVVHVRMDEVDDQRLDAGRPQRLGGAAHRVLVERHHDLSLGVHALRDFEPKVARDERLERPLQAVRRRPRPAPQLQHITEAGRRDEASHRALPLEERVRRRRRAVDQDLDRCRRDTRLAQGDQHALRLIADGRRHLGDGDLPGGLVHDDEIREGAAHVDANQIRRSHDSRNLSFG
jgi:hypothetical protein